MKIYKSILIFILSIISISICNGLLSAPIVLDDNSGFQIQWEITNNDTITFQVSANVVAWLGIGWHTYDDSNTGPMEDVDFIIAVFNGTNNVQVYDMVSTPGSKGFPPILDTSSAINGTYDILSYSGYQTADYSTFIFSRKLVTGDTAGDRDVVVGAAGLDLVWAHGTSNSFSSHGYGNAGRQVVDLGSGNTPSASQPDYFGYHVGFMFFTFGVLMPFGIFVARYLKESHMWWFPVHIFVQITGCIFTIIGIVMAWKMVGGINMTNHAILGTTTLVLFYCSIFLGATSHFMWNPQREKPPIFPDIIHWIGGRLTLVFGFVTIILGMLLAQVSQGIIVVFGLTFASYFLIVLYIEFYKWKWPSTADGYHAINHY